MTRVFLPALAIAFLVSSAQAKEAGLYLQLSGASVHAERRADGRPWNQRNWGLGLQYVAPGTLLGADVNYFVAAGGLKNSEFGQSSYLGGGARKPIVSGALGELSLGAFAGLMNYPSRYDRISDARFYPIVLPSVNLCAAGGAACLDTYLIPKVLNLASAAVLFQGRIRVPF